MRRTVAFAPLLLAIAVAWSPAAAQNAGPQCQCSQGPGGPPDGGDGSVVANPSGGKHDGGSGADGLIGLVPLGPLGALLAAKGVHQANVVGTPLLLADSSLALEPSAAAESRAAIAFRANLDSLSGGMRAPDTATDDPAVLLLGTSLLLVGGLLLRRPSA